MIKRVWHTLFLEERPSIGLSFFRIFAALTTGFHVIPSFMHMGDNYLPTAFKLFNANFFPEPVLDMVQKSPEWLIWAFMGFFCVTWFMFLTGLCAQVSCILMTLCCYYFYALNSFHIGTLSWDILLVTLFLMCITPYHGDYFSLDALRRNDPNAFRRRRPFFIQRLLQLQIASTYFYTALSKITADGNWLAGNPMHVLMNYPPIGVTKNFMFKEWLAVHPGICHWLGIGVIAMELLLPFMLFYPKTRRSAIVAGCAFHVFLILTLDVPAIFFFLFPAQLLLFIHPQRIMERVEDIRRNSSKLRVRYDGDCGFCQASIERLKVMDLWGRLTYEPVMGELSEVKVVEGERTLGGFDAFRRLCWYLPMLYPFLLIVYLPGAGAVGRALYALVARNRYLLHSRSACAGKACGKRP